MNDRETIELQRAEIASLKGALNRLIQEQQLRAAPRMAELIDSLTNQIKGARAGNADAQAGLRTFFKTFDAARDAASSITIVRNGG